MFEDEKCTVPVEMEETFENLPEECSLLYLAMEGRLAAVICVSDPVREEASDVISLLHESPVPSALLLLS